MNLQPGICYRHPADDLPPRLWRPYVPRDPIQEAEDLRSLQQFIPLTPGDQSYLRDDGGIGRRRVGT